MTEMIDWILHSGSPQKTVGRLMALSGLVAGAAGSVLVIALALAA